MTARSFRHRRLLIALALVVVSGFGASARSASSQDAPTAPDSTRGGGTTKPQAIALVRAILKQNASACSYSIARIGAARAARGWGVWGVLKFAADGSLRTSLWNVRAQQARPLNALARRIRAGCPTPRPPPPPTALCLDKAATLAGTGGNDVLTGTPGDDVIAGLAGDDVIDGLGGNDLICGGDGNDRIDGNTGTDTIDSGTGADTCLNGESGENCSAAPVITFSDNVSQEDREIVPEALDIDRRVYLQFAAIAIDGITVHVEGIDLGARQGTAGNREIHIYTGGVFWARRNKAQRIQVISHEYFHLLQEGLSRLRWSEDTWLREGAAQFISYLVVATAGLSDFASNKADVVRDAKRTSAPLATCAATAPNPDEQSRCLYSLGFVAVDFLVARYGGLTALANFWKLEGDGLLWQDAFTRAFGKSVDAFYVDFEAYRQTL